MLGPRNVRFGMRRPKTPLIWFLSLPSRLWDRSRSRVCLFVSMRVNGRMTQKHLGQEFSRQVREDMINRRE